MPTRRSPSPAKQYLKKFTKNCELSDFDIDSDDFKFQNEFKKYIFVKEVVGFCLIISLIHAGFIVGFNYSILCNVIYIKINEKNIDFIYGFLSCIIVYITFIFFIRPIYTMLLH